MIVDRCYFENTFHDKNNIQIVAVFIIMMALQCILYYIYYILQHEIAIKLLGIEIQEVLNMYPSNKSVPHDPGAEICPSRA